MVEIGFTVDVKESIQAMGLEFEIWLLTALKKKSTDMPISLVIVDERKDGSEQLHEHAFGVPVACLTGELEEQLVVRPQLLYILKKDKQGSTRVHILHVDVVLIVSEERSAMSDKCLLAWHVLLEV